MNQLRNNYDLYALIRALSGVSSFLENEDTKLLELANRRFYEAYQSTPMWPRYLLSAEPRTITNQIVPFTQDGFHIFGAGTSAVNGLYVENGTQASVIAYTKYDTDGTTALYSLIYVSGSEDAVFNIITGAPSSGGEVQYVTGSSSGWDVNSSNAITATQETGWAVDNGTSPAPVVRDLSAVQEFVRMHRAQPFLNNSSVEFDFFVQADGAHVMNVSSDNDTSIYVTYKKQLPAYLTTWDLNGGKTAAASVPAIAKVPNEFFHYMAHSTYADFLRMDGQHDKAILEENTAEKYLANELEKSDQIANNNTVKQRFHTYVSTQSR
tara:strand:- start:210 stop:1178 length:969 start_codon:yes stop_codon:yes gene_type:complete